MFSFLRRKKKSDESQIDENQLQTQDAQSTSEVTEDKSDSSSELAQATEPKTDAPSDITLEAPIKPSEEKLEPVQADEVSLHPSKAQESEIETVSVEVEPVIQSVENSAIEATTEEVSKSDSDTQPQKVGFFTRLKQGLSKTRQSFTESIASLVLGRKEIDDDLLDDLEMILLTADVGVEATDRIIRNLTEQVSRKALKDPEALLNSLKTQLQNIIEPISQPLEIDAHLAKHGGPYVILMVGINGVGKTTTIGKLAKKFQNEGKSVMLAAGDTFRAAAVEQLQTWGERNHVPVIAQKTGADSAAVIFDAIQSAKAKNIDVLIADTAGRLHTQSNLMEELKKVKRVITKVDDSAPHEVMLVIDAGTGQNALNQADQFQKAVGVTGITLTKLDGTAKGGIVFALAEQLAIPVRFIGVGESIDDLRQFKGKEFTEALFDQSQS
ncbi:MAG: signal recognition particle-docking protein FtsY [Thiotrichales bacterium]|nr:signal recognition particle-docking protein FtsY [Thiotrichales bacterium]